MIQQHSVKEVDYGTFISMTEKKEIGKVEIESNQIVFTNKDASQIYKTGLMDDPNRTERLYESGAEFSSEIIEQMSPLVSFLLTWILPLVIFFALGQYMSKKLMNKMGGGKDSMMFGMGKSNAKMYVKSTEGIKFSDVAGEDEAKENSSAWVLPRSATFSNRPKRKRLVSFSSMKLMPSARNVMARSAATTNVNRL